MIKTSIVHSLHAHTSNILYETEYHWLANILGCFQPINLFINLSSILYCQMFVAWIKIHSDSPQTVGYLQAWCILITCTPFQKIYKNLLCFVFLTTHEQFTLQQHHHSQLHNRFKLTGNTFVKLDIKDKLLLLISVYLAHPSTLKEWENKLKIAWPNNKLPKQPLYINSRCFLQG